MRSNETPVTKAITKLLHWYEDVIANGETKTLSRLNRQFRRNMGRVCDGTKGKNDCKNCKSCPLRAKPPRKNVVNACDTHTQDHIVNILLVATIADVPWDRDTAKTFRARYREIIEQLKQSGYTYK
jgi:hypothetical protein